MNLTIPQSVAAVLPLLATILSGWLNQDQLPRWANATIAGLALAITTLLCVWLSGNFTGNVQLSVMATCGYVVVLMQGDLRTLVAFFVAVPSPLSALAPSPPGPPPSPPSPSPMPPITPRTSIVRGNTPRPQPGIPGG